MTKEPIMIDDVDVSECEFYWQEEGLCNNGNLSSICQENKDCIYKRYIRKEQEYNRLSNLITSTKAYEITCSNCRDAILIAPTISGRTKFSQIEIEEMSLKNIIEQLKNKEQECEELNNIITSLENIKEELLTKIDQLQAKLDDVLIVNYEAIAKRYKQALQEIKQIAKDDCKTCTVKLLGEDKINCKRCYKTKILQKCEVIKDANIQS